MDRMDWPATGTISAESSANSRLVNKVVVRYFWGAIPLYVVSELFKVSGNENSGSYCEILRDDLLPRVADTFVESQMGVFQQGGEFIHRSNYINQCINANNVPHICSPAQTLIATS